MQLIKESCPKCGKEFEAETDVQLRQKLLCHNMRVHTHAGKKKRLIAWQDRYQERHRLNGSVDRRIRHHWTDEEILILQQIIENYSTETGIQYRLAFRDHPEWKAKLLANHKMGLIYSKGEQFRKKGRITPARNVLNSPFKKSPEPQTMKFSYCYSCGLDIQPLLSVVSAENINHCPRCATDFSIFRMVEQVTNIINK